MFSLHSTAILLVTEVMAGRVSLGTETASYSVESYIGYGSIGGAGSSYVVLPGGTKVGCYSLHI